MCRKQPIKTKKQNQICVNESADSAQEGNFKKFYSGSFVVVNEYLRKNNNNNSTLNLSNTVIIPFSATKKNKSFEFIEPRGQKAVSTGLIFYCTLPH